MGFTKVKDIISSQVDNGSSRLFSWRKSPTQVSTVGIWFDLAMSPGNPIPKYWFDATPLTSVQVKQSTDVGLYHGSNVSPQTKYLRELMGFCVTATTLPMPMILCDYLMYYPTIDDSVTDPQVMTNSVTLPRYTSGDGVQMMAISTATRTGGKSFTVTYTNSNGVAGRITPNILETGLAVSGSICNSSQVGTTTTASGPLSADIKGNGNIVFNTTGSGTLTGDASLFYNMLVAMTGSGDLSADASLLVSMLCNMVGSNTMSMNITGQLHPTCSMIGTGTLDGNINAFANMLIDLVGSGILTGNISAIADMHVDIVVTGTGLTTENVGGAIWNSIATSFDNTGTMGHIMNSVGAGADPWSTLLPGSYTTGQAGEILGNLLSNIPDSVWNELKTTHTTADSYGKLVQDIENLAKQIKGLTAAQL